jgi:AcrR family transcriptional regulator
MARVNLKRRAEIARAKRSRTRASILQAARGCYSGPTAAPVTVDAVVRAAGLAKGTFYVHFPDLTALEAELGQALIEEIDGRLQPARHAGGHPLTRIATGVTALLRDLARTPARARLVARAAMAMPDVATAIEAHLREDLAEARTAGLLAVDSVELAARMVTVLCQQAALDLAERRIDERTVPDIVRAILRALGCSPREAARHASAGERNVQAARIDDHSSARPEGEPR